MFWIVVCVIVAIILFMVFGLQVKKGEGYHNDTLVFKWNKRQLWTVLALLLLLPGFICKVPANSVGIMYSPFSGTSETTLKEGFHGKNIFDKCYDISTEVQTMTVENMTSQTKDSQFVNSTLDIKYRVSSSNAYMVFKQFRTLEKMSETLIIPTTQRVLEQVTTSYNVMDILGEKRNELYGLLEQRLTEEFAKYGVEFYSISITDMDAGEKIEEAITAEAVAKKSVETAEQELLRAQTEAKQKSVTAQAEQDAARIKAETKKIEAEAEKEANDLLQKSLTEEILIQQWIEKWDGKVPEYYGGDSTDLIFNTGSLGATEATE